MYHPFQLNKIGSLTKKVVVRDLILYLFFVGVKTPEKSPPAFTGGLQVSI